MHAEFWGLFHLYVYIHIYVVASGKGWNWLVWHKWRNMNSEQAAGQRKQIVINQWASRAKHADWPVAWSWKECWLFQIMYIYEFWGHCFHILFRIYFIKHAFLVRSQGQFFCFQKHLLFLFFLFFLSLLTLAWNAHWYCDIKFCKLIFSDFRVVVFVVWVTEIIHSDLVVSMAELLWYLCQYVMHLHSFYTAHIH